jgi:hypothetical protein
LAGASLLAVRILHDRKKARAAISNRKWKAIAATGFAGLILIYYAYTYAAPRGMLGELQRSKYVNQTTSIYGDSPLGLIVTGRAEAYGAILGIAERPLFGFGSWRHDLTQPYLFKAIRLVGRGGPDPSETSGGKVRGAGHSVLLQAWVENGIFPAFALIAVLVLILRVAWFNARYDTIYTPYFIVATISFSWGFLFSPPGLGLRVTIGLFMAFYTVFMDTKNKPDALQSILRRSVSRKTRPGFVLPPTF